MSEIRISTFREEDWLVGCDHDTEDSRVARQVFSCAARDSGWWGDIVWNCQGNTIDASGDGAEEAMERGLKAVEEYQAGMYAKEVSDDET